MSSLFFSSCLTIETMAKFESDGGTGDPSHGEDDQVKVDIDSLISSVESMMSQNLIMSDKCCIFRVPPILRRHSERAYTPNAFSIGPWHRKHPLMQSTEKIKLKYLKHLLSRESKSGVTLKELFESTREIEKEARSYYAGPIDVGVEDFIKLLYLYHDLILVENQIPWLVLELLFNKTTAANSEQSTQAKEREPKKEKTLAQLALQFFANIFSSKPHNTDTPYDGTKHLLDLLRNWLVKSSGNDEDVETPRDGTKHWLDLLRNRLVKSSGNDHEDVQTGWEPIPSATDLVDAGINLKVSDAMSSVLLNALT
ncbi:hypothetical protein OIU74_000987 [Salix koriyanagi]|uniref:Uncharacterized protein n=1 Tax=Salix koriyanagi TaxID=2511006 RepID=A0A9Q1AN05_9ROSI|nr:hypothetical protein OIU74_000987 [Salix koriyanagi]KAJ6776921.1 hypothetical protein OIU74_000987 [Salix koriyanagi]